MAIYSATLAPTGTTTPDGEVAGYCYGEIVDTEYEDLTDYLATCGADMEVDEGVTVHGSNGGTVYKRVGAQGDDRFEILWEVELGPGAKAAATEETLRLARAARDGGTTDVAPTNPAIPHAALVKALADVELDPFDPLAPEYRLTRVPGIRLYGLAVEHWDKIVKCARTQRPIHRPDLEALFRPEGAEEFTWLGTILGIAKEALDE